MLACGHEGAAGNSPLCTHLRCCREPWIKYVRRLTGCDLDTELLCLPCAEQREKRISVDSQLVCEKCFAFATTEVGDLVGIRGKPGIRTRADSFNVNLQKTALPKDFGTIVDIAPVDQAGRPVWLLLSDCGVIFRMDAGTGEWSRLASVEFPTERDHTPWVGHALKHRLHGSRDGAFAAVVNDYGRYGRVVDLRSGAVMIVLDGGDYHSDTVPFSFAFANVRGRVVAIHRTAWNRLDFSDPCTGELLSQRDPTSYRSGEERPPHYLDYFHGALHVSPNATHIADDGWVWHPFGMPTAWSLDGWISENVWESEDGATKKDLCGRSYYWDHAIAWIDENRIAVGGIGDDDEAMIDGARIFDVSLTANEGDRWRTASEIKAFAGPAGAFFSDGFWLFSSDETGLSRWDLHEGVRTGHVPNFWPTHHHPGARELVQLIDGVLVRWSAASCDSELRT
jgi:hypothetical protein